MKLDHVGIAVHSIEEARGFYEQGLELPTTVETEEVAGEKVRVLKLSCATPSKIELIEPISEDSPIAKFLEKRGPGLHHLCYASENIEADMRRMQDMGLRVLGDGIRIGAGGMKVVFFHPKDTFGVLTEIAQH